MSSSRRRSISTLRGNDYIELFHTYLKGSDQVLDSGVNSFREMQVDNVYVRQIAHWHALIMSKFGRSH